MTDPLLEIAQRRVGTTLCKKYRIDGVIGVGGMAAVYKGQHRNGHRVAVKMLHPQLSLSQSVCARFLKEAYVANAVDHPGAVRVIDDDIADDGAAFLVMELLDGETLAARHEAAGNKLPARDVVEIGYRLLDVLAAAHAKQIIHRDIKPENLFVTRDGQVKVLDFGIARMSEGAGASATRTGSMMGTPAFMPPEQAMGLTRDIDGRTDLWAVGATMFTVLSGAYVHETETVEQMVIFAATRPARSLATVAPHVPAPIIAVVDRALAFDKTARHADARAMQTALGEAYAAAFGVRLSISQSGVPASGRPLQSQPALDPTLLDSPTGPAASGAPDVVAPQPQTPFGTAATPASTAAGFSSTTPQSTSERPAGLPSPRRTGLIGAIALVGLLVGGAGVFAFARSSASSSNANPAAGAALVSPSLTASASGSDKVTPTSPASTASTSASASVTTDASVSPVTAPLAPAAGLTKPAAPHVAVNPGPASPGVATPRTAPAVAAAPAGQPAAPAAPAAPPPAAAATKSCDPPFFIDPTTGTRKVKPGC